MTEITFPKRFPCLIVKKHTPAWDVLVRICTNGVEQGHVYHVSEEEFESLQNDVIAIDVPQE